MKKVDVKLKNEAGGCSASFKKNLSFLQFVIKFTLFLSSILLFGGLARSGFTAGSRTLENDGSNFSRNLRTSILESQSGEGLSTFINQLAYQFYADRYFIPAWTLNAETNLQYPELSELFKTANYYGLASENYTISLLDSLRIQMKISKSSQQKMLLQVEFEKTATQSAFRLLINLAVGINPDDSLIKANNYIRELPIYLNYLLQNKNIKDGFLAIQPGSDQYISLQKALQLYLQKVSIDTVHYTIRQLQNDDSLVVRVLINEAYLNADSVMNPNAIETAIKKLQRTCNIKQTGTIDDKTLTKLSKSTQDIYNVIALNLDRLRKDNLPEVYCILVNIPEFKLFYRSHTGELNTYKVVVGKTLTPTPLLASRLDKIIFNPCWNVPRSITIGEILPKLQNDSLYLSEHDFSLIDDKANPVDATKIDWNNIDQRQFNYYIRQQNCENNALGALKFLFPNQYSVYLHDTPSKKFFNEIIRAYSHGCVRVQYPERLAQQLVQDGSNYAGNAIDLGLILRSKETFELKLTEPISINIGYYTCTSDSLGNLIFHPDIYRYDDKAIQQLFARNSR
jgi:L,D-transpeptidase YcbB